MPAPPLRLLTVLLVLTVALTSALISDLTSALTSDPGLTKNATPTTSADAVQDLAILVAAYPGLIRDLNQNPDGTVHVVLQDGASLVFDDGRTKDLSALLDSPDLQDSMSQPYPLGPAPVPGPDVDPGRARVIPLFQAAYGHTLAEVEYNCERVPFLGQHVLFNRNNGASQALARVGERLAVLLRANPGLQGVLLPLGGTICWRMIAGTQRLSAHSFAMAIDLNPHLAYWRTASHAHWVSELEAFPWDVVDAFEAEGFIWGGKWNHFDLMHFEYRPELILKARGSGAPEEAVKFVRERVRQE